MFASVPAPETAAAFLAIAELDGDAAWVLDCASGQLLFCSPAIEALTGFSPAQLAAHLDGSACHAALEALCGGLAARLARFAAGDASRVQLRRQFELARPDGSIRAVDISSRILCDAQGAAWRLVGRVRDDNARRTRALEQKRFASMLNHEFRTPLSTIDGAIQRLEATAGNASAATLTRYRRIGEAVDRLIGMLDDYLSPDRMAALGRDKPASAAEPLVLLHDAAQYGRALGRSIEVDAGDLPGSLRCQPDGIAMALRVLVDNAVQYTPAATPIWLEGRRAEGGAVFVVRDAGPGIPVAEQPRIFDKGFRGENAAGRAGSGLGLYLAKSVIEVHGGSLTLENGAHSGAAFKIWLPVLR